MTGGIVSDKFEKRGNYMTKTYVCILGAVLGIPTIIMCTMIQTNFWLSIAMLAIEFLLAEGWIGPTISMIVTTISPQNKGYSIGAFYFLATVAGTISNFSVNFCLNYFNADKNKSLYGTIIMIFVVSSYTLSIPFFYLAGIEYTKFKKN